MAKKKNKRPGLHVTRCYSLGVPEASAIAALPDGRFLVVDDELGLHRCSREGEDATPISPEIRGDLEGVCVADDGRTCYVLCEHRGVVWRGVFDGEELIDGEVLGTLPRVGQRKNGGWEGIAWVNDHWHDRPALVAAHQCKPRIIGVYELPSLREVRRFTLSKAARKQLGDLNDLAIDAASGRLFVVSGKAGRLAELTPGSAGKLELVGSWRIRTSSKDVPEGLCFDSEKRMWIVTDGAGELRQVDGMLA